MVLEDKGFGQDGKIGGKFRSCYCCCIVGIKGSKGK